MENPILTWEIKPFNALSLDELYKILQLRQEVFVLEQACVYNDLDDKDRKSAHLMAWHGDALAAYTRLIPYGISYSDAVSIGRVVVANEFRGEGVGKELMVRSIAGTQDLFGRHPIKIGAQQHLKAFYNRLGFEQTSEPYLDAGIAHIEMTRL
ncbi:GNAT family N-acetyltransferase [Parapedobacter indicus]|uniref:ElaA protein n=1 Tax=Parapedobacter indicus TaxID=1477437 RepID=A0A1I3KC48_9SPHI|nr:GNAT family N-acetyltransferase [Parapedobacter indicus]PPL01771.1 ElaA protein [Parapedobacter indicus]SFI69868.1 ElaA protein [Parapedobacter indicus]